MKIIELNEDTKDLFAEMMGPDLTEDLDREFYRGLGALDEEGDPIGVLVYELKNLEEEEDTKAEILMMNCQDETVKEELMDTYNAAVRAEDVKESFYELPGQDEEGFFEKLGFSSVVGEGSTISVPLKDLIKMPIMKGKIPDHIGSIADLDMRTYKKGITRFLFNGKKGLLEDLAYLPMNWFETDVSAYSQQDGKINGFLLVRKTPSGTLDIKLFIASGPDYVINLLAMIRYSIQRAFELYPPDTLNVIKRHNTESKALAKRLLPGAKGTITISGERKES